MQFLSPGFLWAAAFGVAAVVAIHLIAWRRPDDLVLPTARFVPESASRRSARLARPTDLLLLALRALAVALAGIALAHPVVRSRRSGEARVLLLDQSTAVASAGEVRDSAGGLVDPARTIVLLAFDTTTRGLGSIDDSTEASRAPGSLSAGLLGALRAAARLEERFDRVEIVVVSPFMQSELDEATVSIRAQWRGPVRLVRVAGHVSRSARVALQGSPSGDDPVWAGLRLATTSAFEGGAESVRLVRSTPAGADSAWAREGGVLLHWPTVKSTLGRSVTSRESTLASVSEAATVTPARGVSSGDATLLGQLRPGPTAGTGRILLRWLDGAPAAWEASSGSGCVRTIGFDVPADGDLPLTPAFQRLARSLVAPCGVPTRPGRIADAALASLGGPGDRAPPGGDRTIPGGPNRTGAMLLMLALAALAAESLVRRRATMAAGRLEARA